MLIMAVERFKNRNAVAVYRQAMERGRLMPEGLTYVGSWVEANFDRCFQLVETEDARLLQEWAAHWQELIDFEFVPVVENTEATETIRPFIG
jgi:hypothetical protein